MCWVTAQEQDIAEISIFSRQSQGVLISVLPCSLGLAQSPASFLYLLIFPCDTRWVSGGYPLGIKDFLKIKGSSF